MRDTAETQKLIPRGFRAEYDLIRGLQSFTTFLIFIHLDQPLNT